MNVFSNINTLVALARVQVEILKVIRESADVHARREHALLTDIRFLLADIKNAFVAKPAVGGHILIDGKVIPMGFQLQDIQKVVASFQFTDADNNPTPAPAGVVPQWSSSDVTKATVAAAPDGMTATIAGQSGLGDVQISVSAPGTSPLINASDIVTIVPGPPAGGTITFGTPS